MTALLPVENIVLTLARAHVERGEAPDLRVAAGLVLIIERMLAEAPDPGAVLHLLTGDLPDGIYSAEQGDPATGRLLVTVYPSGSGEVAYRSTNDTRERWGVPSPLSPAP